MILFTTQVETGVFDTTSSVQQNGFQVQRRSLGDGIPESNALQKQGVPIYPAKRLCMRKCDLEGKEVVGIHVERIICTLLPCKWKIEISGND